MPIYLVGIHPLFIFQESCTLYLRGQYPGRLGNREKRRWGRCHCQWHISRPIRSNLDGFVGLNMSNGIQSAHGVSVLRSGGQGPASSVPEYIGYSRRFCHVCCKSCDLYEQIPSSPSCNRGTSIFIPSVLHSRGLTEPVPCRDQITVAVASRRIGP